MTATSPVTSLDGQVALVTGSSRGIGAVIARRMAQAGAKVALNYNASVDAAMEVKDSISNAGGDAMLTAGRRVRRVSVRADHQGGCSRVSGESTFW